MPPPYETEEEKLRRLAREKAARPTEPRVPTYVQQRRGDYELPNVRQPADTIPPYVARRQGQPTAGYTPPDATLVTRRPKDDTEFAEPKYKGPGATQAALEDYRRGEKDYIPVPTFDLSTPAGSGGLGGAPASPSVPAYDDGYYQGYGYGGYGGPAVYRPRYYYPFGGGGRGGGGQREAPPWFAGLINWRI